MNKCDCYNIIGGKTVCFGTKNAEECYCDGNLEKCTFYNGRKIYYNRRYVEKLLKLMQENPTLEVMCKVDSDIVADDGYAWWLGSLNTNWDAYVDEYSDKFNEIIFKSDNEYRDWVEWNFDIDDFAEVPDEEWDDFCKQKIDEVADWKRVIIITIVTP